MTREAKIGMLTGLGVIVFIGVLLSNYLGDPKAGGPGTALAGGPTGRMATLPVGDAYRQQVLNPVGVPAVAEMGPRTMQFANGSEITTPIDAADHTNVPPTAFAADMTPSRVAVAAIEVGPMTNEPRNGGLGGPPTFSLTEPNRVPVIAANQKVVPPQVPAQATYVVAQGDSLGKIAKKFYNSSKNSDVQRIIAANPTMLKDASSMLVVGKKLIIPGIPAPANAVAPVMPKAADPVTIYLPGDLAKTVPQPDAVRKVQPPAAKTNVYVVQSGDTLEKIARKLSPTKVSEMRQKLVSLNAIKDVNNLQVGSKLKVPA